MALDEWVYLIATDGSNASYLLPISFWGGVAAVRLACAYAAGLAIGAVKVCGLEGWDRIEFYRLTEDAPAMMSLRRLARMAKPDSGEDDEAVLAAFMSYHGSYNAEWAFQALLGAACAIGRHRPQLLDRLLPRAIDPGVCIGAVTLEDFWRYGEFCVDRALFNTHPRAVPDFDEESAAFFRNELRHRYEPLVSRLLEERLALPND